MTQNSTHLIHPPEWRKMVRDTAALCRSGPTAVSISGAPGSGRSMVLDQFAGLLATEFEHTVRIDGRVFGSAELALRSWMADIEVDAGTDTFAEARQLLSKTNHVLLLIDRLSASVMDALLPPDLGGVVIASTLPAGPRLPEHRDLPVYPPKRGWQQVQRRRDTEIVTSSLVGPAPTAVEAVSLLSDKSLRALVSVADTMYQNGEVEIGLREVLGHILPDLTDNERAVLGALGVYGPGRLSITAISSVSTRRRQVIRGAELEQIVDLLDRRGLVGREGDEVIVDAALVAAVQDPRGVNAAERRTALHAAAELRDDPDPYDGSRLDLGLRLLHWCHEAGIDEGAISDLRDVTVDALVDNSAHVSALLELDAALVGDDDRGASEQTAHHLVDRGLIARILGRLDEALDCFEGALAEFGMTKKSHRNEAMTLSNIGMIHQERANHRDAADTFDHARSVLARADGDTVLEDVTISVPLVASLLSLGMVPRAEAELREMKTSIDRCSAEPALLNPLRDDFGRLEQLLERVRAGRKRSY